MKGNGQDGCCKSFFIIDNQIRPAFDLQVLKVIAELTAGTNSQKQIGFKRHKLTEKEQAVRKES